MTNEIAPGWYVDPLHRFDFRYWNGSVWTDRVSTAGVQAADPMELLPPGQSPSRPPPSARGVTGFRSPRALATTLTVLFACLVASALVSVGALLNRVNVMDEMLSGNIDIEKARSADTLVSSFIGLTLLLTLAITVVFIIWFHRVAHNNVALGRDGARYSPGWAIGSWFIPFANLVIPVLIAQDVWRGSDPTTVHDNSWHTSRGSALVGWWWALFLISRIGTRAWSSTGDQSDSPRDAMRSLKSADNLSAGGMLVTVAAAILAIAFVRRLSDRQIQCHHELLAAPR